MPATVKALIYEIGKEPVLQDVDPDLPAIQKIVGGFIEDVCLFDQRPRGHRVSIICNEDGKRYKLPFNRNVALFRHPSSFIEPLVGTFLVAAIDGKGELVSLTESEIETAKKSFIK